MLEPNDLSNVEIGVLDDFIGRIEDIDNCYSCVAVKLGQLYIQADEHALELITAQLGRPMRSASINIQVFDAMLDELKRMRNRPKR